MICSILEALSPAMVAAAIFGYFQLLLLLCGEGSDVGGGRGRLATSVRNTAATWRPGGDNAAEDELSKKKKKNR